ncbi:MAG: hypothetical protein HUU16_00040 [Candidatus Omnitrophica bacterium]|nr:hypothetical protein [Candidatus Omnitrophota bacterium]
MDTIIGNILVSPVWGRWLLTDLVTGQTLDRWPRLEHAIGDAMSRVKFEQREGADE